MQADTARTAVLQETEHRYLRQPGSGAGARAGILLQSSVTATL